MQLPCLEVMHTSSTKVTALNPKIHTNAPVSTGAMISGFDHSGNRLAYSDALSEVKHRSVIGIGLEIVFAAGLSFADMTDHCFVLELNK
jgi:hypothetical protein